MKKLTIFVCENFSSEFSQIVENEGFEDVIIQPYSCLCENKREKLEVTKILGETITQENHGIIICSRQCDIIKLIPENAAMEIIAVNYCFNHLANEKFTEYVIQHGGYIVGLGWLNNWKDHIEGMGFTREMAKAFYQNFAKELVFFDAGINKSVESNLMNLSEYLEIPHVIIPIELDSIVVLIRNIVYKWRLQNNTLKSTELVAEAQAQCAEYATLFDIIGKIALYTNKRDTIEKIKEIYILIFGAQQFRFVNYSEDVLPIEMKNFLQNPQQEYLLLKEENKYYVKIKHNDKTHGVIAAGDFMFPEYIEKYLRFSIEISRICGLVLSNIEQYERLMESERDLQYLSFHDSLTGLYNRTYLNEILKEKKDFKDVCVVSFDIDRLKYVNDQFGHLKGDQLISSVASILKKCFRETDIVARVGGDEFVAIIENCDIKMAEIYRSRMLNFIRENNDRVEEDCLAISISIGMAVGENNEVTYEWLLQKADELMYADKFSKRK